MMKPDQIDHSDTASGGKVLMKRALIGALGGLTLIFLAGVIAGLLVAASERGGPDVRDLAIVAATLGIMVLVAFGCWKFWPSGSGEPVAQSTRKATQILYVMFGVGVVLGGLFSALDGSATQSMFSNGPIGDPAAALAILVWVVAVPVLTWKWWRTVDEHEAAAYADSGLFTAHAYLIIVPAWWLATRAGWLPQQDPMIVWLALAGLWSAIWFYRRYF